MVTLKVIHILGVSLFVGNIVVSAVWKYLADQSRDTSVIKYSTRLINLTDLLFTATGAALLLFSGHMLTNQYGGVFTASWITHGYILFVISGVIWVLWLLPIQIKQAKMVKNLLPEEQVPEQYFKLSRTWSIAGTIATLTPLLAIYPMVSKGV